MYTVELLEQFFQTKNISYIFTATIHHEIYKTVFDFTTISSKCRIRKFIIQILRIYYIYVRPLILTTIKNTHSQLSCLFALRRNPFKNVSRNLSQGIDKDFSSSFFFIYILENSEAVTSLRSRALKDNWWLIINYSFNEDCLEIPPLLIISLHSAIRTAFLRKYNTFFVY